MDGVQEWLQQGVGCGERSGCCSGAEIAANGIFHLFAETGNFTETPGIECGFQVRERLDIEVLIEDVDPFRS
jgi:hypothetical protein